MSGTRKILKWVGSSFKDLRTFPPEVKKDIGHQLAAAQDGEMPYRAKPLKGYPGATVLEICDDHDGDTYRAVYTVKFDNVVFVLHAFQKKSKSGISTPPKDLELIGTRLKQAQAMFDEMTAVRRTR